jgi:hypothetical protein
MVSVAVRRATSCALQRFRRRSVCRRWNQEARAAKTTEAENTPASSVTTVSGWIGFCGRIFTARAIDATYRLAPDRSREDMPLSSGGRRTSPQCGQAVALGEINQGQALQGTRSMRSDFRATKSSPSTRMAVVSDGESQSLVSAKGGVADPAPSISRVALLVARSVDRAYLRISCDTTRSRPRCLRRRRAWRRSPGRRSA